ncbi:GlcG/HbpS family heme-binding protein [Burkholderia alba]|uniref:GlcG/HbpS family heme-binding protein n=1 Tax=Burkholderia alba TaxID=2683677 RepID=UPI002B05ACF1|nr:heme-binding protein [Burkholderia alba]
MQPDLTFDAALRIVHEGLAQARGRGLPGVAVAVVDRGAHLVAFARMDGTFLGAIDLAIGKAATAARFRTDTATLGTMSGVGGPLWGIERSNGGLVTFGGGLPLFDASGACLGALGVSGGTVADDESIARRCAAPFSTH